MEELIRKEKELKALHETDPEAYKNLLGEESKVVREIPKGRTDLHFAAAMGLIENVHSILGNLILIPISYFYQLDLFVLFT